MPRSRIVSPADLKFTSLNDLLNEYHPAVLACAVEQHGIYWRGRYKFGNIPLVNYLPGNLRDRMAPHVRVYSAQDVGSLFAGLPVRVIERTFLFGGYDNIIARWPAFGRTLRGIFQGLERTPARVFGLSHFWTVEKL